MSETYKEANELIAILDKKISDLTAANERLTSELESAHELTDYQKILLVNVTSANEALKGEVAELKHYQITDNNFWRAEVARLTALNAKYRESLERIERGVMCYTNMEIRGMVREALALGGGE